MAGFRRWGRIQELDNFTTPLLSSRASGRSNLVDVEARLCDETELGYKIDDGSRVMWVRKRHVEYYPDDGIFTMPYWYAYDKGLI